MRLKNVSASQLSTFNRCNRKWHWEKIKGFYSPSTESQRRGTAIHHALEHFVNTGTVLDSVCVNKETGRIQKHGEKWMTARFVNAAKPHLPKASVDLATEMYMSLPTEAGPPWIGYMDLSGKGFIIDYKTSSSIRLYAKTEQQLRTDPQAASYAKYIFEKYKDLGEVTVTFLYLETCNKIKVNTKAVSVTFTRGECDAALAPFMFSVFDMVKLSTVDDTLSLTPNPEACNDYGGCPHRDRCGKSALAGMFEKETKGDITMSSFKNMMGKKPETQKVLPPDAAPRESTPEEVAAATAPKKKTTKKKGLSLYINCIPVKGTAKYELFESWIQPVVEAANEFAKQEFKIPDFRLLDYSKEKAIFAKALEAHLEASKPSCLVVMASTSFARDALQILVMHATHVVRSVMA